MQCLADVFTIVGAIVLTMAAFSASLNPASGSGGSSPWPRVSNWPCPTPAIFFSSSEGVLSLSWCFCRDILINYSNRKRDENVEYGERKRLASRDDGLDGG